MRRGIVFVIVVGALVASFGLGRASAQEAGKDQDAMQKAWMDLGKPGPEHAEMAKMAGDWDCVSKSYHEPGKPPKVSKGKATFSMILGGRVMRQDYQGEMDGQTFKGIGYTAYNKATKKWESIWMDDMSTGIMFSTGTETGENTYTYKGSFFGPGGKEIKSTMTMKKVSDDEQTFEMTGDMGMGPMKMLELTYKRAK